jgi:hypothetical protein
MADTSWEESQKRGPKKRLLVRLLVLLLVVSLTGTALYNNRDFLSGFSSQTSGALSRKVFSADVRLGRETPSPVKTRDRDVSSFVNRQQAVSTVEHDTVSLDDIPCRVMDRNDIRIRLSLKLFFNDAKRRREIPARREAMTVMVQKAVSVMALENVKIDKIKPALLTEINACFENNLFNDIVLKNLTVEKVNSE